MPPKKKKPVKIEDDSGATALSAALEAESKEDGSREPPDGGDTEGPTDEADAFFANEARNGADGAAATGPPALSPEEREALTADLKKTEDEINTLRQVLQARLKHAGELKRKLGLSPWVEFSHDLSTGLKTIKESGAYQKTSEAVHHGAEVVSTKLGALKNSPAFKSFGETVGNAYTNVKVRAIIGLKAHKGLTRRGRKAKIAASTSMQSFTGHGTNPTTPANEQPPSAPLS